jgi:hypothetical protein
MASSSSNSGLKGNGGYYQPRHDVPLWEGDAAAKKETPEAHQPDDDHNVVTLYEPKQSMTHHTHSSLSTKKGDCTDMFDHMIASELHWWQRAASGRMLGRACSYAGLLACGAAVIYTIGFVRWVGGGR